MKFLIPTFLTLLMSHVTLAQVNELSLTNVRLKTLRADTYKVWTIPPLGPIRSVEIQVISGPKGGAGDAFLMIDEKPVGSEGFDVAPNQSRVIRIENHERYYRKAEIWFTSKFVEVKKILLDYNEVYEPQIRSSFHSPAFYDTSSLTVSSDTVDPNLRIIPPDEIISHLFGAGSHGTLNLRELIEVLKKDQNSNSSINSDGANTSNLNQDHRELYPVAPAQSREITPVTVPPAQPGPCIGQYCLGVLIRDPSTQRVGRIIRVEKYSRRILVQFDDGEVISYKL